jgi:superfamily II DNA or RNA helicase
MESAVTSLETRFRSKFAAGDRSRGDAYFGDEFVQLEDLSRQGVFATVENGYGDSYDVGISFGLDGSWDSASCSCPRFADGHLCKHLWATLLEADLETEEDDLGDDLDGNFLELGVTSDGQSFGLNLKTGRVDSPGVKTGQLAHREPPAPLWQNKLRGVAGLASRLGNEEIPPAGHRQTQREIWYVLDLAESTRRSRPVILFRQREQKANGEPGVIKPLYLDAQVVRQIAEPQHRNLLSYLMEFLDPMTNYDDRYSHYSRKLERSLPPPVAFRQIIPQLCESGRFVVCLSSDQSPEEGTTLTADDGAAWRFRVDMTSDAQARTWTIAGTLWREGETADLSDLVILFESGLLVLNDRLARFESEDNLAWLHTLRQHGGITIPWDARAALLTELASIGGLDLGALPDDLRPGSVISEPTPTFRILRSDEVDARLHNNKNKKLLLATVEFSYAEYTIGSKSSERGLFVEESDTLVLRDRIKEAQQESKLSQLEIAGAASVDWRRDGAKYQFAASRLPEIAGELIDLGWRVQAQGRELRKTTGSYRFSVSSGIDWFDLDAEFDFDGQTATLPALLKAVRSGEKFVELGDGSCGMLPEEWLEKYGRLLDLGQETKDGIRFRAPQALLLDSLLAEQADTRVDRRFRDTCRRLKKFSGVKPKAAPRGFKGELRDYQKLGLGWLNFLCDFQLGGCLADDMGLGKTIQVLGLLEQRRTRRLKKDETRRPSLIVVPKSLVFNWIDEAARFTPRLRVLNYTGIDRKESRDSLTDYDAIVTTYGTLRQDILILKEFHFDYAILDEAQAIKNSESQAAKSARVVVADHRLALTGTPIENHLGELWSLFEFLNPGMLGRSASFRRLTKGPIDAGQLEVLSSGVRPFLLRRTKDQVLTELPDKTEQTLYCEMKPKQRKLYDELRDYYRKSLTQRIQTVGIKQAKIHVLEALLRLRQAACHPGLIDNKRAKEPSAKLDVLLEQLEETIADGHKTLVFSQFTSLLSIVRQRLDKQGIRYEYLDGKTNNRKKVVERFQTDEDCPLFLISLKAGGNGLNLTAADYVFILDPWWNPAAEAQAIDRAHRIGQTRNVFAYRLICRDTVEERIVEMQKEKKQLADAIISADNSLISSLTAADLQLLLS